MSLLLAVLRHALAGRGPVSLSPAARSMVLAPMSPVLLVPALRSLIQDVGKAAKIPLVPLGSLIRTILNTYTEPLHNMEETKVVVNLCLPNAM
jgi:hypothetical protein